MSEPLVRSADDSVGAVEPTRAFARFFDENYEALFGALCLVTHDRHEAEELAQDAFMRMWERWDSIDSIADPQHYLYRVALNGFRMAYRHAQVVVSRRGEPIRQADDTASVDDLDATMRALASLSRQQRASVVLIDLLGMHSEEAAEVLKIRASTVRMHLSRAHAALVRTMGANG
jgi:RNA polymerase sigma-70 factor, ECF subfamily